MLIQTVSRLLLIAICLGALPLTGCGARAEDADINIPMPEETAGAAEEAEQDEDGDAHVVEIIVTPSPTPVVTPAPAITPSPTPSLPEVTSVDSRKGYTSKAGVNLRAKPTTDSEILDTLDKALSLTITGEAEDWYRVKVDGETGYISREFIGEGDVPSTLTIDRVDRRNGAINVSGVNMRKEPSTKGEIIDNLDIFTHFTITGENEKWFQIEYDGKKGYVTRQYAEYASGYYTSEELYLVAQLVHQEAKNTTLEGKVAVANVVYNRMRSSKFPDEIEEVVFEEGQFSPAENERALRSVRPNSNAVEAVLEVFVRGKTILPRNVLYFRAARLGTSWTSARRYYETYGGNCFFK